MLTTARKIALARSACSVMLALRRAAGKSPVVQVSRAGLNWELDLREGVDFAIYTLGSWEHRTQRLFRRLVRSGYTVLDVGANVGGHTLPLALSVGDGGRVIAFEPTNFAMSKLTANVALNPRLITRIVLRQTMLVADKAQPVESAVFSSWPLFESEGLHAVHRGRSMDTRGARAATLDSEVALMGLDRVDFVKLDVDGHEAAVIAGAVKTLERHKPTIVMELAPYLYEGRFREFEMMINTLGRLGYTFVDALSRKKVPSAPEEMIRHVAYGSSRNLLARALSGATSTPGTIEASTAV